MGKPALKLNAVTQRIGLYVRVSSEEQASNPEGSIKNQEQRLRSHVDFRNQESRFGEVVSVFIDAAKSGKDTNRPELQKLLTAIRNEQITMVMVTELSRLSRSIRDFCAIWELMRANGCQFLSLREQFDTTTAAGEMVLYTIANIAQFERKQTSERTKANFQARAERGLFNGGSVPFGYKIDPDKKGYLFVNEDEAQIVREAFKTFLMEGSLFAAGKSLNERGFCFTKKRICGGNKARVGHFTPGNLYDVLTNRAYLGQRIYRVNGEEKISKAVWEPIVNEKIFAKVQEKLKANYRRNKARVDHRYPFLLSGLTVCGQCGDRLPGKSAHGNGGKIPYYEHGWATRRQAFLNKKIFSCHPHRVLAKRLEPLVWDEVIKLLTQPDVSASLMEEAHKIHEKNHNVPEQTRLRNKILGIQEQIEALAEHLTKIPKSVSPVPIYGQMERLQGLKDAVQKDLEALAGSTGASDEPLALKDYQAYLNAIRNILSTTEDHDLRTKIVQRLVQKVEVLPESVRIHYYVGQSGFVPIDSKPKGSKGSESEYAGDKSLKESGSNTLTFGWGGRAHGEPFPTHRQKRINQKYRRDTTSFE
ncbi:MAG: recombinase family protein [Deltaproteobacteria bacterium]|nr:recombinase family protein [Deltaproteobacteria bacterium]